MTKFFADRRVHLMLVTLGFAALAVADVLLSAVKDGTLTLPASLGPVLAPYVPLVGYMIASWRRELGQASATQQMIASATGQAAQSVVGGSHAQPAVIASDLAAATAGGPPVASQTASSAQTPPVVGPNA